MKKRKIKKSTVKYFQRLDKIPIWNFIQIVQTKDLRYLILLDDYDELPEFEVDVKIWESIYFEYLDTFGETSQQIEYRRKSNDFWFKYWTYVATKNRKLLTKIEQLKRSLVASKEIESEKKFNFDEQVAILDNHFTGVTFDVYKMSAKRYFTQLKIYQKQIEQQKKV